jgi:hypothetical protein
VGEGAPPGPQVNHEYILAQAILHHADWAKQVGVIRDDDGSVVCVLACLIDEPTRQVDVGALLFPRFDADYLPASTRLNELGPLLSFAELAIGVHVDV